MGPRLDLGFRDGVWRGRSGGGLTRLGPGARFIERDSDTTSVPRTSQVVGKARK